MSRIEKRVFIQAPPEIVFRALTDAKELSQWFCDRAVSDPRSGGELTVQWKGIRGKGQQGRAVFSTVEPPTLVRLEWQEDGSAHSLTYRIRATRTSTEVSMVDEGEMFADGETHAFVNDGWNSVLLELKDHCEQRHRAEKAHASAGFPDDHDE
jgi:uncharacterized protein YndB with AHSA1/START domain